MYINYYNTTIQYTAWSSHRAASFENLDWLRTADWVFLTS